MKTILDRIAGSHNHFHPKTTQEFFVLRLAQKLGEPNLAHHYLELCEKYSESQILIAYQRAVKKGGSEVDLARRFHVELSALNGRLTNGHHAIRLAAFKIERRSIAVAVCHGERLDHTQTRQ